MLLHECNPITLYLPLLTHRDVVVRQQACLLLLSNHGQHGFTLLRRLLAAPDAQLRQQARMALEYVSELTDLPVYPESFQGLYVECLGRLRLYAENQEVRLDSWVRQKHGSVGWQKLQGVLGYLIHCGQHGTTLAALETAVWGSSRASTVGRTLHTLRDLFISLYSEAFAERALTVADTHCLLNPDAYRSDSQAFAQAFALATHTEEQHGLAAAAPLYSQVLRLYGGPYMIDLPQGAPWAQAHRDHLQGSFLIAAERIAEHTYSEGHYEQCASVCSQIFETDESADEVVAWLLRAYRQLGRPELLEYSYQRYLLANGLDERSPEAQQDVVVTTYAHLQAHPDS